MIEETPERFYRVYFKYTVFIYELFDGKFINNNPNWISTLYWVPHFHQVLEIRIFATSIKVASGF